MVVRMGQLVGKELNHIPFRGAGPAMQAVIAGQVPMMSDSLPSAADHIRQGIGAWRSRWPRRRGTRPSPTCRPSASRASTWPAIPGSGSRRRPACRAPVVERLNRETRAFLADPEVRARLAELGGTPGDLTAEGYGEFVRREVALWAPLVQASGATPD